MNKASQAMYLQRVSLLGRRFAIQFVAIMTEFGQVIPWLDGVPELGFMTNGVRFRDELLHRTRQEDGTIRAYQFVTGDANRTFIGGLLNFDRSPERLLDHRNREIAERLAATGYSYVSCFQVRLPFRSLGTGRRVTIRALQAIIHDQGPVWGVVSDPRMLAWYRSLGAAAPSPPDNRDHLWIVDWSEPPTLHNAPPLR